MSEEWKWASIKQIKEAAEELKATIRTKYPDAQFRLARAQDDRDAWNLWTLVDIGDLDEVNDVIRARELEMLIDENIPLYVIPTRGRERFIRNLRSAVTKTG